MAQINYSNSTTNQLMDILLAIQSQLHDMKVTEAARQVWVFSLWFWKNFTTQLYIDIILVPPFQKRVKNVSNMSEILLKT